MRFWTTFSRWIGPGGPPLGGDPIPIGPPVSGPDNLLIGDKSLTYRDTGQTHRVVVACSMPTGATQLTADLWVWEESTSAWYKTSQTSIVVYPNTMVFSDVAVPLSTALRVQGDVTQPGGELQCFLVAHNPGSLPAGEYKFAMAPNLSGGVGAGGGGGGPTADVNIVSPIPLPVSFSVPTTSWMPSTVGALANSGILRNVPGRLYQAFGFNSKSTSRYLMFFDSVVPPANGTPAWLCLDMPGRGTFSVDLERPRTFLDGLSWAVSTTPGTLTIDASAAFWMQAEVA